ncbi:uncharacterized protein LOC119339254 [Triticum dicoccoides]|uniref:uncharacterized protein LOC119339254 n=1 Tax=Triticum dicoccoides TaxID=85692 RepID=UPI001891C490|nr:uncharacterized protein LOC119339254 [Triticum dicoccoides]
MGSCSEARRKSPEEAVVRGSVAEQPNPSRCARALGSFHQVAPPPAARTHRRLRLSTPPATRTSRRQPLLASFQQNAATRRHSPSRSEQPRPPSILISDRCRRSGSGLPSRKSYRLQLLPAYRLRPFASSAQPTDALVPVASSQSVEQKMKRNGDIKSFFWNYEAAKRKKAAAEEQLEYEYIVSNIEDEAVLPPPLVHSAEIVVDIEDEAFHSDVEIESDSENEVASPQHPCARPYNIQRLPPDPGERIPISAYDVDDQVGSYSCGKGQ